MVDDETLERLAKASDNAYQEMKYIGDTDAEAKMKAALKAIETMIDLLEVCEIDEIIKKAARARTVNVRDFLEHVDADGPLAESRKELVELMDKMENLVMQSCYFRDAFPDHTYVAKVAKLLRMVQSTTLFYKCESAYFPLYAGSLAARILAKADSLSLIA
ncbi:hypothetical protein B0T26DRAFT_677208 [Lasiosphaeria miniovina]|uniref:Uncharacterized protein n=1 Tax=Lasiosphaeria miniovina TaxID=1954250 RepID=A0AA40DQV5_9PEZI|nr:uncharacterized protein B0T26DRAFT_677208 [Lasiosphaeria miniovina]KAK0712789.1 hypothetical protein B0T26DRAFT_677208 [Lasiosphaeria miniovina]